MTYLTPEQKKNVLSPGELLPGPKGVTGLEGTLPVLNGIPSRRERAPLMTETARFMHEE